MNYSMVVVFIVLFIISILLNRTILSFVKTLGIRGKNNISVRWSNITKPSLGGINFYIIFLISIVIFTFLMPDSEVLKSKQVTGLFIAATLAFILGLADDAYNTNPFIKLTGQVTCGVLFVLSGNQINFFNSAELDTIITLLWVIGLMNSINMLDNMDGITTISSIGILICCLIVSIYTYSKVDFNIYMIICTIAGLIGFLIFNFYPSKMFMGDTGSQFLGVICAYFGVHYGWNIPANIFNIEEYIYLFQMAMIMVIFALPLMDTTTVTINRLFLGKSPMVGGKDHTTHYLSRKGWGDKNVGWFFIIMSLFQIGLVLLLFNTSLDWIWYLITIFGVYFISLLTFGLIITRNERLMKITNK